VNRQKASRLAATCYQAFIH